MSAGVVNLNLMSNAELLDEDDFFWEGDGFQSHLHAIVGDGGKIINSARIQDQLKKIDCSSQNQLVLNFKDATVMQTTQGQWQWLSDRPDNTLYFIVDGEDCGGPHGREQYAITHVTFNTSALTATLSGSAKPWTEVIKDGVIRVKTSEDTSTSLAERDVHSVSIAHDFSTNLLNGTADGVTFALECAHCATTGGVDFDVDFQWSNFSLAGYVRTNNGFGASLGLGLSATGEWNLSSRA
ncbi:hypothetical protein BGZ63DRAFT_397457 [Mariannaea sp. PMI_226]|nr:hypothetical protein BGZ63DRAFT_397457 [Mariannaea sp. PMI_226]